MPSVKQQASHSAILAFYGSDILKRNWRRFLRRAAGQGYQLVTLDSSAMSLAQAADVSYSVLDDELDPADIAEAIRNAAEARMKWFEPARDLLTVDGVCWPELDQMAMRVAWENAFVALKWAEKLKGDGVTTFRFFRNVVPRFQVASSRSDIAATLWEKELPKVAKPLRTFELLRAQTILSGMRRAVQRAHSLSQPKKMDQASDSACSGGIVVVMAELEASRYSETILNLNERFPDKVAVAVKAPYPQLSDSVSWKELVPVYYGPLPPGESVEAWILWRLTAHNRFRSEERFLQGYATAVEGAAGTPWAKPLALMKFHFDYYCRFRWPWLYERGFMWWRSLWERIRPSAVLCSSLEDASILTAVAAAKVLGIPTLSRPHGGIHLCYNAPFSDYVFYGNGPQRAVYEGLSVPKSNLIGLRGLVAANEYPATECKFFSQPAKFRLLALTDTTDMGTNLAKWLSLRRQFIALKGLVTPPDEIRDRIELLVKTHPHYRDLEMIAAVGPELTRKVLPADSDLHCAVRESDVVVAVNYWGTALIHVLFAGKPVIYLLSESEPLVNKVASPFGLFRDGTTVVRTLEEFWKLVQSLMTDPELLVKMSDKAKSFSEEHLDYSRLPSLAEAMQHLVRLEK